MALSVPLAPQVGAEPREYRNKSASVADEEDCVRFFLDVLSCIHVSSPPFKSCASLELIAFVLELGVIASSFQPYCLIPNPG